MSDFLRHLFVPHHTNNQRARLLHPSGVSFLIGVYVFFQLALGWLSRGYPQILGYASVIKTEEIISLTNRMRQENGLAPIQLDSKLTAAAAQKASDMFARDYWSHVSPVGTQPWYFITNAGYSYRYAGENLARDFADSDSIVKAWMASPTHRDNLLNPRYQDMGLAIVDGKLGGRETTLVIQMFGTKLGAVAGNLFTAKAAESTEVTPKPVLFANRFDVGKWVSIALLTVFSCLLIVDIVWVIRKKITRWTSKSVAHLAFMIMLILAVLVVNRGLIL
jgi:hypothetical protein